MTQLPEPADLEAALAALYHGPLEEFISRRDALVKQLRAAKRRDDADRAKAVRKPSRTAWVLDNIVHEDPAVLDQLSAAINAAQTAQSGTDLRAAMDNVRAAIRDVAAAGARVAIRAGHPIDASALVTAVHAVIGETNAFSDLRAGRLVDVPAGGGLDILAAISINLPPSPPVAPTAPSPTATQPAAPESPNDKSSEATTRAAREAEATARAAREAEAAIGAARAHLQHAESALADANERSHRANKLVRESRTKLDAAEQALLRAQAEAEARRADAERARRDADDAAAYVRDAERAVAAARARLTSTNAGPYA
jgi:hypothetical protein